MSLGQPGHRDRAMAEPHSGLAGFVVEAEKVVKRKPQEATFTKNDSRPPGF